MASKFENIDHLEAGFVVCWLLVTIYPLLVIPGPLPNYTGPRYVLLSIISLLALLFIVQNKVRFNKPIYFALLFFLLFVVLSTVLSEDPLRAWGGTRNRYTGLSTYISCAIIFITATNIRAPVKILKAMVYFAALVSVIAILQHYDINIARNSFIESNFHSYGTMGNPNFLGTYTVFILPASIMLFFKENHTKWLVIASLLFAALAVSMTRGSWIAFAVIIIILSIYVLKKQQYKLHLLKTILIFVFVFGIISITGNQVVLQRTTTVVTEIESAINLEDRAGSDRMFIWKEVIKTIPQNWVFGVGPDNIKIKMPIGYIEDKAFNHFLEIALSMGFFALISYITFLYFCIAGRSKGWLGTTLLFMVIAYLVQGQFNIDTIMNLPLYWLVLGLMQNDDLKPSNKQAEDKSDILINSNDDKMLKVITNIMLALVILFIIYIASIFLFTRQVSIEVKDQGVYTGQMRGYAFNGYGTLKMLSGSVYEGEFKNGLFDGQGILLYINGSMYVGEFKEGYMHGQGKIITADGQESEGIWERGMMIR